MKYAGRMNYIRKVACCLYYINKSSRYYLHEEVAFYNFSVLKDALKTWLCKLLK